MIERNVPFYACLPEADRHELQGLVQIFLAEKTFEGCGGLVLTDEIKVTIAAQACLLLLHRQTDIYPRLITILVYPSAYVAKASSRSVARSCSRANPPASASRGPAASSFFLGRRPGRGI